MSFCARPDKENLRDPVFYAFFFFVCGSLLHITQVTAAFKAHLAANVSAMLFLKLPFLRFLNSSLLMMSLHLFKINPNLN